MKSNFRKYRLIFLYIFLVFLYLLIENGTTFLLKTIPLIGVKPVALQMQKQHKNDDKYGYQARNYQTVLPGI